MRRIPFPDLHVRIVFLAGFLLAALLLLTGTWQLAYLAGFLAGMLSPRLRRAVLLGALGVSTAWAAYLVYVFVMGQGLQLADLVGRIFGLGGGAWWLLTVLTLVLAIVLGAVGAMTGYAAARLFLWETPSAIPEAPKG
ncbi:MAG TPA: hypothetical protein VEY12_07320 [Thermoplasmata archaeon]|nr:hypothetical protein [Thermoplasmata archaeon]